MINRGTFVWNIVEDYEVLKGLDRDNRGLFFPDKKELIEKIRKGEDFYVIATFSPPPELEKLFIINRVRNKYGALTSQEVSFIEQSCSSEEEKKQLKKIMIERKLRLKIHAPKLSLKDLKGMFKLKEEIKKIIATINHPLLKARGVFLVGIPGTGKSYSCKCVAGELNRWLIEMNLSRILEDDRPIDLLFRIFEFLETFNEPSILWIDEIDKVFTGGEKETKMMGQLLTILNEFNTEVGFKADAFFWVTANNIMAIAERNPEFFRRFDYLFFIQTPYLEEVYEIFKMYFNKYSVYPRLYGKERDLTQEIRDIILTVESVYRDFLDEKDTASDRTGVRFLYTPAEIETIVKKCAIIAVSENRNYFTLDDFEKVIKLVRPVRESMRKSIEGMLAQKSKFVTV